VKTRRANVPETLPPEPAPAAPVAGPIRSWAAFWFTPADPIGLHAVRFLAGLLFLGWLLTFAGQQDAFFGLQGWLDRQAYREASRLPEGLPAPAGWSLLYLFGNNSAGLHAAYWLSLIVVAFFAVGLWTRLTSVLTWLIVASFIANPAISHGADFLLGILALYLMIGYVLLGQWGKGPSLASRLLGSADTLIFRRHPEPQPSYAANLALRLVQVHFALVVVVSGLHKLQFGDWWSGAAFWYPLHPPFETTPQIIRDEAARATSTLFIMSLAQYVMLAWQIGFPVFAWRKRWRPVLLLGAVVGWIGSVFLFREPVAGPVLCVACLSFVTPAEWRAILGGLAKAVRLVGGLLTVPGKTQKAAVRT
jgi:hypothetical protein